MNETRREDILLGLFVLGTAGLLVALSLRVGSSAPPNAVRYHFVMDGVLGLQKDNRVTIAGVNVGVVDNLAVEGRQARMTVAIAPDVTLYADAQAAVRARTLLGEKYVDLDPGAPPSPVLAGGSTVEKNVPTMEIDSVIRGAAELVSSLNAMTPTLKTAAERLEGVLATADMKAVARDLTALIKDADDFILAMQRSFNDSSQDARILLRDLRTRGPDLLSRLEGTARRVDEVLAAIPADSVQAALKKAPGTLDSTEQTLSELRVMVAELRNTSLRTTRVLENLDSILSKAATVNEQQIRELLQVEGIRVNLITDPDIERRVRSLARPPAAK